jgi:hypothetical protein
VWGLVTSVGMPTWGPGLGTDWWGEHQPPSAELMLLRRYFSLRRASGVTHTLTVHFLGTDWVSMSSLPCGVLFFLLMDKPQTR